MFKNKKGFLPFFVAGGAAVALLAIIVVFILVFPPLFLWVMQHFLGIMLIAIALVLAVFGATRNYFENKGFLAVFFVLLIVGFMFTFIPKLATLGAIGDSPYVLYVCEKQTAIDTWADVKDEARSYSENYGCNKGVSDYKYSLVGSIPDNIRVAWYDVAKPWKDDSHTVYTGLDEECSNEGGQPWALRLANTRTSCEELEEEPLGPYPSPVEPPKLNVWQKIIAWFKSLFNFQGWGI